MTQTVLDEHLRYVRDSHRLDSYRRALATVARGARVLDLGSGTGVLGLLAAEAGASHVVCVDASSMIELARENARANGHADRMTFLRARSTEVQLNERVDVVVADQMAPFAVGAGLVESFHDARVRHLREGGTLMPSSVELWLAPVHAPAVRDAIDAWGARPAGLDFAAARELSLNTAHWTRVDGAQVLGAPARLTTLELGVGTGSSIAATTSLTVERAGAVHGLCGFFVAHLAEGISITNSPHASDRVDRDNIVFPLAVEASAGDRIDVRMRINHIEPTFTWTVEVHGARGVRRSTQSTLRGMILSREDLARSHPDHRPQLSSLGAAYLTVLRLADGTRSIADLEREVAALHADQFRGRDEVAGFVARVVSMAGR